MLVPRRRGSRDIPPRTLHPLLWSAVAAPAFPALPRRGGLSHPLSDQTPASLQDTLLPRSSPIGARLAQAPGTESREQHPITHQPGIQATAPSTRPSTHPLRTLLLGDDTARRVARLGQFGAGRRLIRGRPLGGHSRVSVAHRGKSRAGLFPDIFLGAAKTAWARRLTRWRGWHRATEGNWNWSWVLCSKADAAHLGPDLGHRRLLLCVSCLPSRQELFFEFFDGTSVPRPVR